MIDLDGNYSHGGKQARTEKTGAGVESSIPQRRSPLNLANLKTYGKWIWWTLKISNIQFCLTESNFGAYNNYDLIIFSASR